MDKNYCDGYFKRNIDEAVFPQQIIQGSWYTRRRNRNFKNKLKKIILPAYVNPMLYELYEQSFYNNIQLLNR